MLLVSVYSTVVNVLMDTINSKPFRLGQQLELNAGVTEGLNFAFR